MRVPTIRRPKFRFDDLPNHWVGGSRVATQFGNAGHVFVPLGEQFFIDTVKLFRDELADPEQRKAVNAFIGQEAVHARAHEAVWEQLRSHGVPIDDYVRVIDAIRSLEGHLPATFRLSVTAALEHYTAAFGHSFLSEDLSRVVPDEMARLLAWHGLEELEHRSVAFDVLREVDGQYATRIAGFATATAMFVVVPAIGTGLFLLAGGGAEAPAGRARALLPLAGMTARLVRDAGSHLLSYLDPRFHPDDMVTDAELGEWAQRFAA